MIEFIKKIYWISRNWSKWVAMRSAWTIHREALVKYGIALEVREQKRRDHVRSGAVSLQRARSNVRKTGADLVRTGGEFLTISTEMPWLKLR